MASDDIVTRLIHEADHAKCMAFVEHEVLRKAADEIERLRTDRDRWRKLADDLASAYRRTTGLDGAWERANLEYEQAVRGD